MTTFLNKGGAYRKLRVYQVAEIIYDVTYLFAKRWLNHGDRTVDQMIQAARSGKQNIAEGSAAGVTSKETEIKLTNVARASLQELLIDYEDFLRVRGLEQWPIDDVRTQQTRLYCRKHNNSADYRQAFPERSAQTMANIAIVLIHQADAMLDKLLERQQADFLAQGGIREQMSRARREYRDNQKNQSPDDPQSPQSPPSSQKKDDDPKKPQ